MAKLRGRVLAVTISLIVGTVALCTASVYFIASNSMWRNLDGALLELAKTEVASATDTGVLHVHETGHARLTVKGVPGLEKYVWIEDDAGKILASTENVPMGVASPEVEANRKLARSGLIRYADLVVDQTQLRTLFYPFKNTDGRVVVGIVGVPSSSTSEAVKQIGEVAWGVGLLCVIVAGIAAVFLSEFVAVPITDLAKRVESTNPLEGASDEPVDAPYAELDALVRAFNQLSARVAQMLDEREETIATQRRFVADTSHELRTPVSNLRGTIEVALRKDRDSSEYREALSTSLREVARLSRLIDDLLTLAKSDAGEFSVHLQPTDVPELVRQALAQGAPANAIYTGPESMTAHVDPDRLRQALDNLVRNASIHAKSRIEVRIAAGPQGWDLAVGNDGSPLTQDEIGRIFERFVRLDESRSRDTGGSGLGLSIVKAIMAGHGGRVRVESNETWTEFVLAFPK